MTDPQAFEPVLIGSWSEAAKPQILATLDPLAAMARADAKQLDMLLAELEVHELSIDSGDALDVLRALLDLVPIEEDFGDDGSDEARRGRRGGGGTPTTYESTARSC